MMIGACDAQLFYVHWDTRDFHYAGPGATYTDWLDDFKMTGAAGRLKRTRRAGEPWAWTYTARNQAPSVWAGVDAEGNILMAWEAEEYCFRPNDNPIHPTDATGQPVLPAGGAFVQVLLPGLEVVTEVEALLAAANLPEWVAGTLEELYTPAELQISQWERMRILRNLNLGDIRTILNGAGPLAGKKEMILLWLRAASQVLFNHEGETAIPLMKAHFSVDPASGVVEWK
ncbi:MAG: hypothetical protein ACE15F_15755 [bacterium]